MIEGQTMPPPTPGAKQRAKDILTRDDPPMIVIRAALKLLYKEINRLRPRVTPPLPTVTEDQFREALLDEIANDNG